MTWWTQRHVLWVISGIASILVYALVAVAVPVACLRLPGDYFTRAEPVKTLPARVATLGAGSILVIVGVAMMFLPGPGILTIVLGLTVIGGGQSRRLLAWLVSRPRIFAAVNEARQKRGIEPLAHP